MAELVTIAQIHLTPKSVSLDGKMLNFVSSGAALLNEIYRERVRDYPKYFKMDPLSRLGFIATELLLEEESSKTGETRKRDCEDRAVILFNTMGSYADDVIYQRSIGEGEDFFPSPSAFVYTLPNIVTGEIAIRNKYYGETCFYCLPGGSRAEMEGIVRDALEESGTCSAIWGRLDCLDEDDFDAELYITVKR